MRSISLKRFCVACALCASLMFAAHPAWAKKKPAAPAPEQAPPPPPPDNSNAQAITAAQQELTTANAALKTEVQKATATFEASDEMVAAKKALAEAQSAYDAAAGPVLSALEKTPDYAAAVAQKQDASDKLTALRANGGDPSPDEVSPLAQQEMTANATVHSLAASALTSDAGANEAKTKLDSAQAAITTLRVNFQKTLTADPEYVSAKQAVDDAQKKLAAAQSGGGSTASAAAAG
jgi:cysteinyl-tRNA synthetase